MRDLTHFQEVAGLIALRLAQVEMPSSREESVLAHLRRIEKEMRIDPSEFLAEVRDPSVRRDRDSGP